MLRSMYYLVASLSLSLCMIATAISAEESPAFSVSSNFGIASDYISRGLRLNWGHPAIQASIDVMHHSGWYVSAGGSQLTDNYYANGSLELDLYGGYRGKIGENLNYDAGLGAYFYPGANYQDAAPKGTYPDKRYDTVEAIFGITYDWLNLKYSRCLTDYFGYDYRTVPLSVWNSGVLGGVNPGQGTRGSGYLEANANFDFGSAYMLDLHAARQIVTNSSKLSYNDYKLSVAKGWSNGWSVSLALTSTQGTELYDNFLSVSGNGKTMDIGGTNWLFGVNKSF
jgi:uncharacterized protein (TIGR02001 family)